MVCSHFGSPTYEGGSFLLGGVPRWGWLDIGFQPQNVSWWPPNTAGASWAVPQRTACDESLGETLGRLKWLSNDDPNI